MSIFPGTHLPGRRYFLSALFFCVSTGLLGCQRRETEPIPTYQVTGQLFIDNAPANGAMIKFHSRQLTGRLPTAVVRENGEFSASYYGVEDGAPAGRYALLIIWMKDPPAGGMPIDRLQGRYCDPKHPVATVTVSPGRNHLSPIRLTTRAGP